MPSSHFIFIPGVLMVGVVIGWILGARAARDAYAAELKRRDERAARTALKVGKSESREVGRSES